MDKRPWTTHEQVDAEFTEAPALAEEQLDGIANLFRYVAHDLVDKLPEGPAKTRAIGQLRLAWSESRIAILATVPRIVVERVAASDEPTPRDELARIAYATYGQAVGGVNFQGDPMPEYEATGDRVQRGWLAVGARMFEEGVRYARTRGGQDRGTP